MDLQKIIAQEIKDADALAKALRNWVASQEVSQEVLQAALGTVLGESIGTQIRQDKFKGEVILLFATQLVTNIARMEQKNG